MYYDLKGDKFCPKPSGGGSSEELEGRVTELEGDVSDLEIAVQALD